MVNIWRVSLDEFWSREPGTVRVNLTIIKKMGMVDNEELVLEGYFIPMGT